MRIAIFTNEEYDFLFDAWRRTILELRKEHEIVGLWIFPDRLKNLTGLRIPLWYLRMFGPATFCRLAARTVMARLRQRSSYASMAKGFGIPFFRAVSPNAPEVVAWVKEQGIDVVFITIGNIIKQPLLDAVKVAVVNKHSAPLPAYRGLLPVFWMLLEGASPIGVTVHKVDAEIDHGEYLVQRVYPEFQGSVYEAYRLIHRDMPELLLSAVRNLETGERHREETELEASYRSLPSKEDAAMFRKKKFRFV